MTVSATSTPMARRRAIRRIIYKIPGPTRTQAHSRVGETRATVSSNCRSLQETIAVIFHRTAAGCDECNVHANAEYNLSPLFDLSLFGDSRTRFRTAIRRSSRRMAFGPLAPRPVRKADAHFSSDPSDPSQNGSCPAERRWTALFCDVQFLSQSGPQD
jgi:hypothetical protein